jgi:SRSO17 transposase
MRWPIETCFEDSKQLLGMGDYEVRSFAGWHHHMTLVMLAHHFLVRLQSHVKKKSLH